MIVCDIGNTTAHFFEDNVSTKVSCINFNPRQYHQKIYYICVHPTHAKVLQTLDNWIDISAYISLPNSYETLGVDRKLVAWYRHTGIVVDAGSAITVDKVKNGVLQGGFIYPGIEALQKTFANISSSLDLSFDFNRSLDKMPLTTQDALTYGAIVPLVEHIKHLSKDEPIVCTGGNGDILAKLLNATYEKNYIFDAMKALIEEKKC